MGHKSFVVSFLFILCLEILRFNFLEAQMVPAMFVFGDSLVDVGNNNHLSVSIAKADFPFNGIDFPTKKPTGRFSNGKNAADFIAEKVGLPSSPPYLSLISKKNDLASSSLTGVSFASGGAGILNGTDQALRQAIPLTKQVADYAMVREALVQKIGSSAARALVSKSLFVVVIGSNDLFDYNGKSDLQGKYTPEQYLNQMASILKDRLKRLHANGARKFFSAGVGPIGCTPSQRVKNETQVCNEELNSWVVNYNQVLKSMLEQLKQELQDINYSYFDTYTVLNNIVQNPTNYGFSEVKAACCGRGDLRAKIPCVPVAKYCPNRRDHLFWDLYHPTEAAANILVDTIFDGPSDYSFPMNLRQLVSV
ncbi:GDSL esterase/lipase At5g55050-like [Tripterygium wilfordii]|uniref:GDSL esterase/lipase At5g55050-like n=1 Tax=Tripterygium wilfordii TaxID=458696 RepID=UPI0018F8044B|nr:GDSL esterase/lipase At5g55050-like [Tripterygium wilfordii]